MIANTPPVAATSPQSTSSALPLHRFLGIVGMIGGPFLCASFAMNGFQPGDSNRAGAALGLLFTIGWLADIVGLHQLGAAGRRLPAKILFGIQMVTVFLANIFQVFEFASPGNTSILYTITDICWPLSMLLLCITSITIAGVGAFQGWRRFAPLVAGLWLPLGIVAQMTLSEVGGGIFAGVHSAIGWFLLGLVVFTGTKADARR
jgi:hypothetical protein